MAREEWRQVANFEGFYEVSDRGRVRSLPRVRTHFDGSTSVAPGRLMRTLQKGSKYHQVTLTKGGKATRYNLHVLVAATFLGPNPWKLQVRHLDGNGHNCNIKNLRYGTPKQNGEDRVRHGTSPRGERHGCAKLTSAQVNKIRALRKKGETIAKLSFIFDVHPNTIGGICSKGWGWLPAGRKRK